MRRIWLYVKVLNDEGYHTSRGAADARAAICPGPLAALGKWHLRHYSTTNYGIHS